MIIVRVLAEILVKPSDIRVYDPDASFSPALRSYVGHEDVVSALLHIPETGQYISASWDRTIRVKFLHNCIPNFRYGGLTMKKSALLTLLPPLLQHLLLRYQTLLLESTALQLLHPVYRLPSQ